MVVYLFIYLSIYSFNYLYSFDRHMRENQLWLHPHIDVILLGWKENLETTLSESSLRNSLRVMYLALSDNLLDDVRNHRSLIRRLSPNGSADAELRISNFLTSFKSCYLDIQYSS